MQRKKITFFIKPILGLNSVYLFRAGTGTPARTKLAAFFLTFLCFIVFPSGSSFSNDQWINYTNTSTISMLALDGNYLWQGSGGGAVRRAVNDPLSDTFYYNHATGLAGTGVGFIFVDHLRRKWFESAGLTVWDGVTSTRYDTSNSGLKSNFITCMAEDKLGRVWIMNYGAATVFDGTNWTTYDSSNSGLFTYFDGVAIDDSNRAWFYESENKGVVMFDGANWKTFNTSNSGLISNSVYTIVPEKPNKVWFGCLGGVSVFDGTNWIKYDTTFFPLPGSVSCMAIDSLGRKWFGGNYHGLTMFDPPFTWEVYNTTNSGIPSNNVWSIVADSFGNIWTSNPTPESEPKYYLTKFNGTDWHVYDISGNQLSSNRVGDIAIDHSGNKWIGTGKGLCKFDDNSWTVYTKNNSGMPADGVGVFAFDTNGDLWMLCGGGVTKFDGINWTTFFLPDSIAPQCMTIDKNNVKWFGTMLEGLIRFDDTTWTFYDTSNSPLPYNWVQSLAVDSSNNLWMGTVGVFYQGLSGWVLKFDGTNWSVYNPSNSGLPFNLMVWSLAVDGSNRIWIGAYWAGLAMFDGTNWYNYNIYNSNIASNNVMDIGFDASGNTWVATEGEVYASPDGGGWIEGGGVSRFDGTSWVTYNTKNSGLADVMVYSVAIDSKGNKWFGTGSAGVSFLDVPTAVVEEPTEPLPKEFALSQNYPNPFNPSTTIPFTVKGSQFTVHSPVSTTLKIYNIRGQLVKTLVDEEKAPGNYKIIWDGKDNSGKEVASGIYFYQLRTADYTSSKKMVLLK